MIRPTAAFQYIREGLQISVRHDGRTVRVQVRLGVNKIVLPSLRMLENFVQKLCES